MAAWIIGMVAVAAAAFWCGFALGGAFGRAKAMDERFAVPPARYPLPEPTRHVRYVAQVGPYDQDRDDGG